MTDSGYLNERRMDVDHEQAKKHMDMLIAAKHGHYQIIEYTPHSIIEQLIQPVALPWPVRLLRWLPGGKWRRN